MIYPQPTAIYIRNNSESNLHSLSSVQVRGTKYKVILKSTALHIWPLSRVFEKKFFPHYNFPRTPDKPPSPETSFRSATAFRTSCTINSIKLSLTVNSDRYATGDWWRKPAVHDVGSFAHVATTRPMAILSVGYVNCFDAIAISRVTKVNRDATAARQPCHNSTIMTCRPQYRFVLTAQSGTATLEAWQLCVSRGNYRSQ